MKLIFIISLPRSGSTLAQRILASHNDISTISEPWLLLPLVYMLKEKGIYAEYSHRASYEALHDFFKKLPDGEESYYEELRQFVNNVYKQASDDGVFFIEKTPRNLLIIDELMKIFPDAKFLFLWRNPVAVIASIIDTFGKGRWRVYDYKIDLFKGLVGCIDVYKKHKEKIISINYEEMIKNPVDTWGNVFENLGLDFDERILDDFIKTDVSGVMGDPTGINDYNNINDEPLLKWQKTISNPFRKIWVKRYLNFLGKERLADIGYDLDQMISDIDDAPLGFAYLLNDIIRALFGAMNSIFEVRILGSKIKRLPDLKNITSHA